jgi:hypothetical protein
MRSVRANSACRHHSCWLRVPGYFVPFLLWRRFLGPAMDVHPRKDIAYCVARLTGRSGEILQLHRLGIPTADAGSLLAGCRHGSMKCVLNCTRNAVSRGWSAKPTPAQPRSFGVFSEGRHEGSPTFPRTLSIESKAELDARGG